jgi:hypothetical protein
MIKASQIDISTVTGEQIGMCHKVFVGSVVWFKVQSESDPLKEYTVAHSKEYGFTCTCPSGNIGFSNCKDGVCKHVKWALACAREEKEAVAELHRLIAEQALEAQVQAAMSDPETIEAAQVAAEAPVKVARKSSAKAYQPKAFSILRV